MLLIVNLWWRARTLTSIGADCEQTPHYIFGTTKLFDAPKNLWWIVFYHNIERVAISYLLTMFMVQGFKMIFVKE